jgi:hypothetical protein
MSRKRSRRGVKRKFDAKFSRQRARHRANSNLKFIRKFHFGPVASQPVKKLMSRLARDHFPGATNRCAGFRPHGLRL